MSICSSLIIFLIPDVFELSDTSDELFKILLIGDSGVGKSCIIIRYPDNTFNSGILSSIGIDFKSKKIVIKNKKVLMQIVI